MEQEIKFEKALERLEQIVEELESGNIPLEEALKRYEEGVKLSRALNQKLAQAETKIETLTRALGREAVVRDGSEPEKVERKKAKKAAKQSSETAAKESDASDDHLLL